MMKFLALVALLFVVPSKADKVLMCYYGSWAVYREGDGQFPVEFLPGDLCTHLIYTFISAEPDGNIKVLDPWADLTDGGGKGGFSKFVGLKSKFPNTKFLVAMGGWNEGSTKYSNLFKSGDMRSKFAQNAVAFLKQHGFDGLDLDWEYPGREGGAPEDKANFVELIKELRKAFDPNGYLLTAAVGASDEIMATSYDVLALGQYLDYINVMTYDFHMGSEPTTGYNAPLYPPSSDSKKLSTESAIWSWLNNGAPASKLVMGIATYGRSFMLQTPGSCKGSGCPASGPGAAGPHTKQTGYLGYNEICIDKGWQSNWDNEAYVPYAMKGNEWIGYDDEHSVDMKAHIVGSYKLAGAMVWSIETDDFRGKCGKGKFPLVTAIKKALG